MVGRPKEYITPEQIEERKREIYQKNQTYFKLYQKWKYLKNKLKDPNYNKKRWIRSKALQEIRETKNIAE